METLIRPEIPDDRPAIRALTIAAFLTAEHTSHTEQDIIDRLREDGGLTQSLVAERDGGVVGHVAISPVTLSDGSAGWFGLGPVSVLPTCQTQGIGSLLVRVSLEGLRGLGASGCVVLGDPRFYQHFGFQTVPGLVLPGVPPETFMAVRLGPDFPHGIVTYHRAFDPDANDSPSP